MTNEKPKSIMISRFVDGYEIFILTEKENYWKRDLKLFLQHPFSQQKILWGFQSQNSPPLFFGEINEEGGNDSNVLNRVSGSNWPRLQDSISQSILIVQR